jgi:hypothetical protein
MTGEPVATIFYGRVRNAAGSDDDDDDDDADGDADAEADDDAAEVDDEEKGIAKDSDDGGGGLRTVRGCHGEVNYIAYHTGQHAASASGVARVHATRTRHLDGCKVVYNNKAHSGPGAPVNYVRLPPHVSNLCSFA